MEQRKKYLSIGLDTKKFSYLNFRIVLKATTHSPHPAMLVGRKS